MNQDYINILSAQNKKEKRNGKYSYITEICYDSSIFYAIFQPLNNGEIKFTPQADIGNEGI